MTFDLVYKEIGDLGWYQKRVLLLGWLTDIYGGFIFINSVFLLYIPDHRCAIPGYDNDSYIPQDENHELLINNTIPPSFDGTSSYDRCHLYIPGRNGTVEDSTDKTLAECSSWVYDPSVYAATIGTKMNLVCDRALFKSSAQMAFFIGYFLGSFTSGIISDRFGRKPTIYTSIILLTLVCLSIAWTPSIEVYLLQSACVGCFYVSMFQPIYCTGMEWVGPPKRLYAGQISSYFWITGSLIMTLFAYLIRDWSMFQLVCAAPGVTLWSYWLFYPESPRWLYTQGKLKEMKKAIQKAASVNKVTISDDFFEKLPPPESEKSTVAFFNLFKHKAFACRIFVLYFHWFVICLEYYGLALNSDSLGSKYGIHLYFFLQMLMDIPGCLSSLFLIDKIGRKTVMIGATLIGGVACIACMFTIVYGGQEGSIATLIFALIGKLAVAAGFKAMYQLSIEIFPTVARNAGFGSCSCAARIGGMIAPLVADLDSFVSGSFGKGLPLLIFGVLSGVAGLLAFLLPETLNKGLTETIREEIEEEKKVFHGNRINKFLERDEKHLKEPLAEQEADITISEKTV